MTSDALFAVAAVVALVPAIILHEISHGVVALWLGDDTAKRSGRLSLNPIRHVDPFGTLILPGALVVLALLGLSSGVVFGYAKPVPVDRSRLRSPRHGMLAVSLSGPLTNLILASIGALVLGNVVAPASNLLVVFAFTWILVNVFIGVFNLAPFPPLDGSEVVAWLLPGRAREAFYAIRGYGFLLLFALIFAFPDLLFRIVNPIVGAIIRAPGGRMSEEADGSMARGSVGGPRW